MPRAERARVVFEPELHAGMGRGMACIAAAVRPTLGPATRYVAVDREIAKTPVFLDDPGVIVRRITSLSDRLEDAGAMYLRGLLWTVHDRLGDGVGTTASIFETVYLLGKRHVAAGGNPAGLRDALERVLPMVEAGIARQTQPISTLSTLECIAKNICPDEELASALTAVIDIAGPEGDIQLRRGRRREIEREFVEGSSWLAPELSPRPAGHPSGTPLHLAQPAILLTDLPIATPDDVAALDQTARSLSGPLVIFADSISEQARGALALCPKVHIVRTPGAPESGERLAFFRDAGTLTGTATMLVAAGQRLRGIPPERLGRVRRAWIDQGAIGLVGGAGDPAALRVLIRQCRRAEAEAESAHPETARRLRERIARLLGGTATLRIGGRSVIELDQRFARAERTIPALRRVLRGGVVPGGGVALLASRDAISDVGAGAHDDQRAAVRIVRAALEAPSRAILANVGLHPDSVLERMTAGRVLDVRTGELIDPWDAGILDSAEVVRFAVHAAVTSAAQLLTVGALVQHRTPAVVGTTG